MNEDLDSPITDRARRFPPHSVYAACVLILAALVFGLLALAPGIRVSPPNEQPIPLLFTLSVVILFSGLTVWFAIEVLRRKNWARWAMLIYLSLGWLLGGAEVADTFAQSPLAAFIETFSMAMEIFACWLLFSGASAQWFRERSTPQSAYR